MTWPACTLPSIAIVADLLDCKNFYIALYDEFDRVGDVPVFRG